MRKAAEHTAVVKRAPGGDHREVKDAQPHALKKGKKGGTFYVSDTGHKVYTKK
jgi:hypothetical protein